VIDIIIDLRKNFWRREAACREVVRIGMHRLLLLLLLSG